MVQRLGQIRGGSTLLALTSGQVIAAATVGLLLATVGLVIVGVLHLVTIRRHRKNRLADANPTLTVYPGGEFPRIHATSSVPTLQQLTQDIQVAPDDRWRARLLYDMGLSRFNHYVNNRDGVVIESRLEMASLAEQMEQSEISLAESTGIALARADKDELPETLVQYNSLRPQTQIYVQHKRREHQALQTIANDLQKNVPRTDYTSVKSLIESGEVPLETIMSELPLPWQGLRTISEVESRKRIVVKPPRRDFIHTIFLTRDGRVLEDKRAERDGNWLRSDKHNMLVPYQEPAQVMRARDLGDYGVPTGESMLIVDRDPDPEWDTEFWRQGGYRDQQYLLARDGRLPEQIHTAYRQKQIRTALWVVSTILAIIDVVMLAKIFV